MEIEIKQDFIKSSARNRFILTDTGEQFIKKLEENNVIDFDLLDKTCNHLDMTYVVKVSLSSIGHYLIKTNDSFLCVIGNGIYKCDGDFNDIWNIIKYSTVDIAHSLCKQEYEKYDTCNFDYNIICETTNISINNIKTREYFDKKENFIKMCDCRKYAGNLYVVTTSKKEKIICADKRKAKINWTSLFIIFVLINLNLINIFLPILNIYQKGFSIVAIILFVILFTTSIVNYLSKRDHIFRFNPFCEILLTKELKNAIKDDKINEKEKKKKVKDFNK